MNSEANIDLLELATRLKSDAGGEVRKELRERLELLEKRVNARFRQQIPPKEAESIKSLLRAIETAYRIVEKACAKSKIQVRPDGRVVME